MLGLQEKYVQLSTTEKVRFWIGVLVVLPACIWAITLLPDSRSSAPGARGVASTTTSGIPASWRDACDYSYADLVSGPVSDERCAQIVRDRPTGWPEADWVRRIKVSGQEARCEAGAQTAQGKDACRMQYRW